MSDHITLTTIGVGSAFATAKDPRDALLQTNFLLRHPKRQSGLLIDVGQTASQALLELGLSLNDVDSAIITHLHADHIGGLECFGLSTYFNPHYLGLGEPKYIDGKSPSSGNKPLLICSKHVYAGLSTIHKHSAMGYTGGLLLDKIEDFFSFEILGDTGGRYYWNDTKIKLELVPIVHSRPMNRQTHTVSPLLSYAIKIKLPNCKKILTLTDTCDSIENMALYQWADLIFHDVEVTPFPTRVHTRFDDLAELPQEIKNKIILVGYTPKTATHKHLDAHTAGFRGYAQKGQVFNIENPDECAANN